MNINVASKALKRACFMSAQAKGRSVLVTLRQREQMVQVCPQEMRGSGTERAPVSLPYTWGLRRVKFNPLLLCLVVCVCVCVDMNLGSSSFQLHS